MKRGAIADCADLVGVPTWRLDRLRREGKHALWFYKPAPAGPDAHTCQLHLSEPGSCHLPPHQTVCRRHRLWIGPSARTHASQLDISQLPEILHAQRRRLAQLHHHQWRQVDDAISDATHAIHQIVRARSWTPRQRQRLCQLDPGTSRPAPAPAGHTTAPAAPPSRSRSTRTSSGWPHTLPDA